MRVKKEHSNGITTNSSLLVYRAKNPEFDANFNSSPQCGSDGGFAVHLLLEMVVVYESKTPLSCPRTDPIYCPTHLHFCFHF
jgi:hypothetical protein